MGQAGTRKGWRVAACALALSLGCGGGAGTAPEEVRGPPVPAAPGVRLGTSSALKIGAAGGAVTSPDGIATVSVPAGALATDVDVTIDVITNTAPSAVGNAYRIGPDGTVFAAPVALVFTPPPGSPDLATLTLARQDENGFWVRQQDVTLDPVAGTLTVTTTRLGDWAIVGAPTGRDLIGVFHLESTTGASIVADGKSSLNFHWGDPTTGWYVQSGHVTAQSPVSLGAQTCTPDSPTMRLAPNVASLLADPVRFRWAIDGRWDLTCGSSPEFGYVAFDTSGVGHLSCARTYLGTPIITPEKLQGSYLIDCGPTGGTVTATWQYEICNLGEPCPPANPCHTASITCDTGLPLCVDDGNLPNGTSCDLVATVNEVCGDGVCNVCRIDVDCEPINVCNLGKYTCDTGFEICTDLAQPDPSMTGQACDVVAGVPEVCGNGTCNACTQDEVCTPSVCNTGNVQCATGFPVCADTGDVANGTACDVTAAPEVCFNGACNACSAGLACATNPNPCVTGVTDCSTGQERCIDTPTNIPNGTTCDVNVAVPEVCFNGGCNACTAGLGCTTNPNECVAGATSCTTGQELCLDTTTNLANGTTCVIDGTPTVPAVCNGGLCNACTQSEACTPSTCNTGNIECASGTPVCVDTGDVANGTSCGTNQVCGSGVCNACTQGEACTPSVCNTGNVQCATGFPVCADTGDVANGTACGTDLVCNAGACAACAAGGTCDTNPNPCVVGTWSCATGTRQCVDTATPTPNTTPCSGGVCSGTGACVACTPGGACSTNPDTACHLGVTSCLSAAEPCVDGAPRANGTSCGTDQVCNGGGCVACAADVLCFTNADACLTGITSCATGVSVCEDNAAAAEPNGTVCGTDQVCSGGVCSACVAGGACSTNPNPCVDGTFSCASGTRECVDTTAPKSNGTICGTDQVCNGGTCSACAAGQLCFTNPDLCLAGTTSCASGSSVCVDDPGAPEPNGTSCGTDLVCNGGVCNACTQNEACTPSVCNTGSIACSSGTPVCVDTGDVANGTGCGTDQVCNGGACVACTVNALCFDNPDPCLTGLTSCATGAPVCFDDVASAEPNGTACGADQVCNGGVCQGCVAGGSCSDNPNPCLEGTFSCASGTQECVDTTTPRTNGTTCGPDLVCNGGSCVGCVAGGVCDANSSLCLTGTYSCASGTRSCVDNPGAPEPNGTTCGTDLVCNGGACSACSAGDACATNPHPCLTGITSCASGGSVCVDNPLLPEDDGTSCGTDLVCNGGACQGCVAELPCADSDPCHTALTSCATGTQTCVATTTNEPNGTVCGADQVCNGGACSACSAGDACTDSDPCHTALTSCATGTQTCVATTTNEPNGTVCGTDQVCNGGGCVGCVAGGVCATNPNPCLTGTFSCATGTQTCVDNAGAPEPNGTSCGTDQVCSGGACSACSAGDPCGTDSDPCRTGVTSCDTGTQACVPTTTNEPDGTSCGADQVCSGGVCSACSAGDPCTTDPDLCRTGVTSCATGTQTCVATTTNEPNGTSCGTDLVCNGGACNACSAGDPCTTDPDPCRAGVTSCASGTQACVASTTNEPDGTSCGTDLVCSGGACSACSAGDPCTGNPSACYEGVTSCASGTQACVDSPTPKAPATSCGVGAVCDGAGACGACAAGTPCSTNPNACVAGETSCATGVETCVDTATQLTNGTSCGTDLVCNGGLCSVCSAGDACTNDPDLCHTGVTSCASGTQSCVPTTTNEPDGTSCGADLVCNGGACSACSAGDPCTTDPDPCHTGLTSCASGTQTCVASTTNEPDGTSCGAGQVCNGGVCSACSAGDPCTTDPDPCHTGVTSCASGTPTCVASTTNEPNGTGCGTDQVCNGGVCSPCAAGQACATNLDPCLGGTTSCASGTQSCVDDPGSPEPNGTICGTGQVCNAGACTACSAGEACATNPGVCYEGVTSCASGTQACVDSPTPKAPGTSCGTDQVCNGGTCSACSAGGACATDPDPCHTGTFSCATGTQTCVATTTNEPNGTGCGTDQVCNGGACTTCVANAACQNPGSCLAGTTSCSTGTSVCVDGPTPLPEGTSCGASSLCSGGACTSVRTVSGTRMVTYWTTDGTCTAADPSACKSTVVAPDVLGSNVSARPTAGGTWAPIDGGAISLAGSFSIPNVPTGPYQLVVRLPLGGGREIVHVLETSSSDVDLGYDVLGRSDATAASVGSQVTLDFAGLTPWLAEDEVDATAFDVDVFDVLLSGTAVDTGQTTTLVGTFVDWGARTGGRSLNVLTGADVLHLHQLSTETATDGVTAYAYQRATVSTAVLGVPTPTTIQAALAPVVDTGTVTVSWDPEAFEALLGSLGPPAATAAGSHRLLVESAPYASLAAAPVAAYGTPQLFRMVRAPGGPDVTLAPISVPPITYGRFLDVALASEWRRAEFAATVSYQVSGATPLQVVASVGRRDRMAPAPATPIVPAVGPVQSLLVAGAPALGTIPATGLTPTLSWSAPAIGTPTRYEVRLHRLEAPSGATISQPVATFRQTATSLTVPADVLQAGGTYYAEITAYVLAGDGFAAAPLRRTQVFSHATTLTSPFSP
jgi:hypothetical protein